MINKIESKLGKGKSYKEVDMGVTIEELDRMASMVEGHKGFTILETETEGHGSFVLQWLALFNKSKGNLIVTMYERNLDSEGYVMSSGMVDEGVRVYKNVGEKDIGFMR